MLIKFFDRLEVCDKSLKRSSEGYLTLQGIIARSGPQQYLKSELGLKDSKTDSVIVIDRPIKEVVDPMSIASFILKPITDNHPTIGYVDINNYKEMAKGVITSVEATDEGRLKAELLITNKELADQVENKRCELSAGYSAEIEVSDDGNTAIQRKIRGNHVAFVDKARCGKECRIFDGHKTEGTNMAKIKINDVEIEIQDAAIPMVQAVIKQNEELTKEIKTVKDCQSTLQAKLDAEIEKTETLKKTVISDEKVVELAEQMTVLWANVKLIDKDFVVAGKAPALIKRSIVEAKIGDAMKGKDDAYIAARFDVLIEDAGKNKKDVLTDSLKQGNKDQNIVDIDTITSDARQRKILRYQNKSVGDTGQALDK